MRKITRDSIDHFLNARPFNRSNTRVEVLPNVTVLYLFGNPIAYKYNDPERTTSIQAKREWQTNTAKERLNGIPGVAVKQVKGEWYLNGKPWDGGYTDIIPL
jgi:hypothetical protein